MHEICENIFSGINTMFYSLSSSAYQPNSNPANSFQNMIIGLFLMIMVVLSLLKMQEQDKEGSQKGRQMPSHRTHEDN